MTRETIHKRIYLFTLLITVALLPTDSKFINIGIGVLAANWIFEGQFSAKWKLFINRPFAIAMLAFYLLHVVALLWTDNMKDGTFALEKKIPLLIFPLIVGTAVHEIDRSWMNRILGGFIAACFIYSVACWGHGLYLYSTEGTTLYLFGEDMTDWTRLQSIYAGIYIAFCAAALVYYLLSESPGGWRQVGVILLLIYFFFFMILLSARTGTFVFVVVSGVGGCYYAYRHNALKWFLAAMIVLAIGGATVVMNVESLRTRIMSLVETKLYFDPEENNANGLTLRLVKWQCSIEGMMTSPLVGVSPGDSQDYLQLCYREKNFWGQVLGFNSHNQYLQTGLGLGFTGMIVLVICLFAPLRNAWQRRDYLLLSFIFIVAISFITESVFERKQGVIFYSLFAMLLAANPRSNQN